MFYTKTLVQGFESLQEPNPSEFLGIIILLVFYIYTCATTSLAQFVCQRRK